MNAQDLRKKSEEELMQELMNLRKEQFNLRMQRAMGQLARPDQMTRVRKNIARVKTVLNEKLAVGEQS